MELYKLGSLSKEGKLPITLQGLWTLDGGMPPWSGDYHLDLNVQMSHWPIYTSNHLELGKPLYETFLNVYQGGNNNAGNFLVSTEFGQGVQLALTEKEYGVTQQLSFGRETLRF